MNFITGNNFKNISNYILDETGFRNNIKTYNTPIYFVKTDYIDYFFNSKLLPKEKFKLITHNSDFCINSDHAPYLEYRFLVNWFAQNVDFQHEKLIPIPIGIANEQWPHGNIETLQSVIDKNYKKKQLMYANFNISTNPRQREYCLQHVESQYVESNTPFETYLEHTAEAYFSICPLGNGIDSHRIWESLYLKTVPIAEQTYNISYLKRKYNLPIVLINDWSDISNLDLNSNTYINLISNFNPDILLITKFLTK